jgi:hypothetical protein
MPEKIQKEFRSLMNNLADTLNKIFNGDLVERPVVFTLLVARAGDISEGRVNYISNGVREEMITMMKEFIARAEGRYVETDDGQEKH